MCVIFNIKRKSSSEFSGNPVTTSTVASTATDAPISTVPPTMPTAEETTTPGAPPDTGDGNADAGADGA